MSKQSSSYFWPPTAVVGGRHIGVYVCDLSGSSDENGDEAPPDHAANVHALSKKVIEGRISQPRRRGGK